MPTAVQSDNVAGLFVPLELERRLLFTFFSLVSRHMQFVAGRFVQDKLRDKLYPSLVRQSQGFWG